MFLRPLGFWKNVSSWNPATQFSNLIFWVDAKQAVSGTDYDATSKALVSWKNQADVSPANDLVPISDTPPVFEAAGLFGNPDFYFNPSLQPVDCGIPYSPPGNGFLPFGQGWAYTGPLFRSYVIEAQLSASTAFTILSVPGVGSLQIGNNGGLPFSVGNVDALLAGHLSSLSGNWAGPIFDATQPVSLIVSEGRTTADGVQRRLYVSSPSSGSVPAFFSAIKLTDSIFGPGSLSPNGGAILFGPNNADSTMRFSECVVALDDPSAGGLDSNLEAMAIGQAKKWGFAPHPLWLCMGDSITGGTGGGFNLTQAEYWPYLVSQSITGPDFLDVGINSRKVSMLQTDQPTYNALLRPFGVKNNVIIWAGTNDIDAAGSTAAGTYANLSTLISQFKTDGWDKVIVMTCIPRNWASFGAGGGGSDVERNAFNALVVANSASADGVIDLTANAAFNSDSSWTDTTIYNATDGIHLTPAGQSVVAGIVAASGMIE